MLRNPGEHLKELEIAFIILIILFVVGIWSVFFLLNSVQIYTPSVSQEVVQAHQVWRWVTWLLGDLVIALVVIIERLPLLLEADMASNLNKTSELMEQVEQLQSMLEQET